MTEQNTFGDRLAALTEAIAARPDALAEDHLTYAEFLLSGERVLEAIVGVVSSTPADLVGKKVKESKDHEYPEGVRAKDEDGDLWVKDAEGWVNHAHQGWMRDRQIINAPWKYNARFIA